MIPNLDLLARKWNLEHRAESDEGSDFESDDASKKFAHTALGAASLMLATKQL